MFDCPKPAFILAGGLSTRMGFAKALLAQNGTPVVRTMCERLIVTGWNLGGIVISDATLADWLTSVLGDAKIVLNPHPETGPIGSLRLAIATAGKDSVGLLGWPIDHPLVEIECLKRLNEAATGSNIAIPCFEGKRGHPVWWGRKSWDLLTSELADEGANFVVRSGLIDITETAVIDKGVATNIDTYPMAVAHGMAKFR